MGSFTSVGQIRLIANEEDVREAREEMGGYPFKIPEVYLEGVDEMYNPPRDLLSRSDDSVVMRRSDKVFKYTLHEYCELKYEENGKQIRISSKDLPEDFDDAKWLDEWRGTHDFSVTVYDLKTQKKEEYSCGKPKRSPMTEHEIAEYARVTEDSPLLDDREKLIGLIRNNHELYKDLPEEYKHDVVFHKDLIEANCSYLAFLEWAEDDIRNNAELCEQALAMDADSFRYFSEHLRARRDLAELAVSKNGNNLKYVSPELRADKSFVAKVVEKSGSAIRYADERLKEDDELIRPAILQDSYAYRFLPENVRAKREYALLAIRYGYGDAVEDDLPENLRKDKELILLAVKRGMNYHFISDEMKQDRDIAKAAVVYTQYSYFSSIPEALRNDEEIARLAIERDPRDLRYVTDKQLIEKLVAEDPNLCHFIPSEDDHYPDFSAF